MYAIRQLAEYQISILNSLELLVVKIGNTIVDQNKVLINANDLADGIYLVDFTKRATNDIRKVIIKH